MTDLSLSGGASAHRRDRAILIVSAGLLAGLAWLALSSGHSDTAPRIGRLLTPHTHARGASGFAITLMMWAVMMVAMMLPSVLPWILFYARAERGRSGRPPYLRTAIFVGGYLSIWLLYSLAAATSQLFLERTRLLDPVRLATGPAIGAAVLILAGLFQLSPIKTACLAHCRSPVGYFLRRWRDGPAGAFGMGARHGAYCVACCWALMAVAFALGVMNLIWMAALTLMLCAEKLLPGGQSVARLFGFGLMIWGSGLLFA